MDDDQNDAAPAQDQTVTGGAISTGNATANVPTNVPGAQPDGTTLDTLAQAAAEKAAVNTLGVSVGDRIATVDKAGASLIAAVVPVADLQRLIELAQQVHHFVANEGSPIVKELMIVAADVGQYL